jgi:hypothetical protein
MIGPKLLTALSRTVTEIALIQDGLAPLMLTAEQALAMARTGLYTGSGTKRKVKELWLTPPVIPVPVWQECWRTISSAVCPPSYGYERRSRGGFAA